MLEVLKKYPRFILFGMMACFFTGPGQTFFLSFFTKILQDEFHFSRTTLSTCFSLSTFGSAFVLPFIGRAFDRYSHRNVAMSMGFLLALGYGILYFSKTIFFIFLSYLLIKSFAQGAMTVIYTSMVVKYFGKNRGKALSLCNLGHPISQSFFPLVITYIISHYEWKISLIVIIFMVLLFFIPLSFYLLPKNNPTQSFYEDSIFQKEISKNIDINFFKDWRFYFVSYGNIMAPLLVSGLFFQQDYFLKEKNWELMVFATGMSLFSLSQFFSNFLTGYLIDKFGATKILALGLIPLIVGLIGFKFGVHKYWCYFFFLFTGITAVFTGSVKNAMWAEVYGTLSLGKIRGVDLQFNIFATAIGPTAYAFLLENGMSADRLISLIIAIGISGIIVHLISSFVYLHQPKKVLA